MHTLRTAKPSRPTDGYKAAQAQRQEQGSSFSLLVGVSGPRSPRASLKPGPCHPFSQKWNAPGSGNHDQAELGERVGEGLQLREGEATPGFAGRWVLATRGFSPSKHTPTGDPQPAPQKTQASKVCQGGVSFPLTPPVRGTSVMQSGLTRRQKPQQSKRQEPTRARWLSAQGLVWLRSDWSPEVGLDEGKRGSRRGTAGWGWGLGVGIAGVSAHPHISHLESQTAKSCSGTSQVD